MKVLITGADGQLGSDLCKVLQNVEVVPCTQNDIEITDTNAIKTIFNKYRPEAVINTAAYVRVDDCEDEKDKAFAVNALGARNIAIACQESGARLVQISTDYVFGGEPEKRSIPYTEFDIPIPCSVYGKSKLAGEELVRQLCSRHFIVRTSGLFGATGSIGKGGNFIETMIKLAGQRNELRVVNDQVFSPTYSKDLAQKIGQLIQTEYYGIFHITNSGTCSWYELAKEIMNTLGLKTPVVPITSEQYPQKARRPRYSVLDNYHLHLLNMDDMRPWQDALRDYLRDKGHLKQEGIL
jgi:dTDP-4-dehydrorhamnose reductase